MSESVCVCLCVHALDFLWLNVNAFIPSQFFCRGRVAPRRKFSTLNKATQFRLLKPRLLLRTVLHDVIWIRLPDICFSLFFFELFLPTDSVLARPPVANKSTDTVPLDEDEAPVSEAGGLVLVGGGGVL